MPHLTTDDLCRYAAGLLSGDDLLRVDDHLAECDECREELAADADTRVRALQRSLADEVPEAGHLTFEVLAALVDATADEETTREAEFHLAECNRCEGELRDLTAFRDGLSGTALAASGVPAAVAVVPASRSSWRAIAVLGTLAAAASLVLAISISRRPAVVAPATATTEATPRATPMAPVAATVASLVDAGGTLALKADGTIAADATLDAASRALLADVMRTGSLGAAPRDAALRGDAGTLMGDSHSHAFTVMAPVGRNVSTLRPTFHWSALKDGARYQVSVYDEQFNLVAQSPDIAATTWTPDHSLPAGRTYAWQVTGRLGQDSVTAPAPPDAEARFHIVDQGTVERLAQLRAAYPEAHLLLAASLYRAGIVDEAARELELLARANPDSALARRLRAGAATRR